MLHGHELDNSEGQEENAKVLGKNWRIKGVGWRKKRLGASLKIRL